MIEINNACDLCNCFWGPAGERECDIGLTRRFGVPYVPPQCPQGYPPFLNPSKRPEFVKQVEDILIAKLATHDWMQARALEKELARDLRINSRRIGNLLGHMKRKGMVRKINNTGRTRWVACRS